MFLSKKQYQVKLKGRSGIEYSEKSKTLRLGSEFMAGDAGLVIYFDTMKSWDPPYQEEKLSEADKLRIKDNITSDLHRNKIPVEWA